MEKLKDLLHELRCDIELIPKTKNNKIELTEVNKTLTKAWVELNRLQLGVNDEFCDDWIHQERVKQNDDTYCPICGKKING